MYITRTGGGQPEQWGSKECTEEGPMVPASTTQGCAELSAPDVTEAAVPQVSQVHMNKQEELGI
jgi:hypothetical protein